MGPRFLVPEMTVTANGQAEAVPAGTGLTQITLGIVAIVEQEALDLTIEGSEDGVTFLPKPLLVFPQKFYQGTTALLLDFAQQPQIRFVRAKWHVNRWGRGSLVPHFRFYVVLETIA